MTVSDIIKGLLSMTGKKQTDLAEVLGMSSKKFYRLSNRAQDGFYGIKEEAVAAEEKRFDRYVTLHFNNSTVDVTEKAAPLVKEYIREKFGVRRVITNDIKVTKNCGKYTVKYRQHSAQLH